MEWHAIPGVTILHGRATQVYLGFQSAWNRTLATKTRKGHEQSRPKNGRFKSKMRLPREIFACRSHRQSAVLDASDGDQMICNTLDNGGFPTNHQDFETVIVIKVYMEGRNDRIQVLVLQFRQCFLDVWPVMIVNESEGSRHLALSKFLLVINEMIANHVAESQRAISIPLFPNHPVKLIEQRST
jgi:hypothetical protein